jgi:hypothetical protein
MDLESHLQLLQSLDLIDLIGNQNELHREIADRSPKILASLTLYALESACVKIVWQREFLLQEVKV